MLNLEFPVLNLEFLDKSRIPKKKSKIPRINLEFLRVNLEFPVLNLEFPRINLEFLELRYPCNDENSKIPKAKSQIFLHNFTKFFKHEFCVLYAHFLLARQA